MMPIAALEEVTVLGDVERVILAGVAEESPATTTSAPGQTDQVLKLLVNPDEQMWPPQRVRVRGVECRVLGSQAVPWQGMGALVTLSRVNPELPDLVRIVRRTRGPLDKVTGTHPAVDELVWSGAAHVVTGVPWVVDSGGEEQPLNKATIALPLDASYGRGLVLIVDDARAPGLRGVEFTLMGEVLESTAEVRRVAGYREGA